MKPLALFLVMLLICCMRSALAQTTEDDFWDHRFGTQGTNGTIRAVVTSGNKMYIGGTFTTAGGVTVNRVAMWDSTGWTALGSGMNGTVYALAMIGNDVYAGGNFSSAGGVSVNNIAKWDGTSWSALGSGVTAQCGGSNVVYALAVIGSDLYVGGNFSAAGGDCGNYYLAKWNGTGWSALGSGFSSQVYSLVTDGTNLYAGGDYSVGQWNGTSWTTLGSIGGAVFSLAYNGGTLYAGGGFVVGSSWYIAQWNGSSWSGMSSGLGSFVWALTVYNGNVYAGNQSDNYIYRWNGSSWSSVGSGMNGAVYALGTYQSDLVASGNFTTSGGVTTNYIGRWTGSNWYSYGGGPNSTVRAVAILNGVVYVGGDFTSAGGISANYIAQWDGLSWSPVGSGMNAAVWSLLALGSDLYAGGQFTTAGGTSANRIAQWDGSSWSALGSGIGITDPVVYSLAADSSGNLYASGNFSTAGGTSVNNIARWDGANWYALGDGLGSGGNSSVTSLAVSGNDVYAGGTFTNSGATSTSRVAKWNGSTWTALGSGLNWYVNAIAISGTDVYVGGTFTSAGDSSANYIAKWDGTTWSPLSSGMSIDVGNAEVDALISHGGYIYVGGIFTGAGGVSVYDIARWNGSEWSAVGSSLDDQVSAFASDGSNLYAGGNFDVIFTPPYVSTVRVARWFQPAPSAPTTLTSSASSVGKISATLNGTVTPNGASTAVRFLYGTTSGNYTDSVTATQSPVTGWDAATVSAGLAGLASNQTYYFLVAGSNSAGYVRGSEMSFTTERLPVLSQVSGSALTFDGADDYVTTNLTTLSGSELTIEYWFKGTNAQSAVRQQNGGDYVVTPWSYPPIHILSNDGGTGAGLSAGNNIYDGNWHHVAMTWKQNTADGFKSYLDGSIVAQRSSSNTPVPNMNTNVILGSFLGVSEFTNGSMDEVRIWSVERSTQQIRENMYRTLTGSETGLVSYWQLNEGTGTSAADSMSLNHGTLVNSPTWITSMIPIGDGTSNSVFSVIGGTTSLGTVTVAVVDSFDNAVDLTATQINATPDSLPVGSLTILEDRYWVVNAFGTPGTFSVGMTFTVPSSFTNNGNAQASSYTLYRRASNSDGAWTPAVTGATGVTTTSVTFDSIAEFSQFILGTNDPLPITLGSFTAQINPNGPGVLLEWMTHTEINNYGFYVERRRDNELTFATVSDLIPGAGTTTEPQYYSWIDNTLTQPGIYTYRLRQQDLSGAITYSWEEMVDVTTLAVGDEAAPREFRVFQNYPNPFNPSTTITFSVEKLERATVSVYNILGQEVMRLFDGVAEPGRYYRLELSARGGSAYGGNGGAFGSGVYFYRVSTPSRSEVKRMLLIK